MSSLIEKPDGANVLTVRITLKPERDEHLIYLIRTAPPRSLARLIRELMRNGIPNFIEANDQNEAEDDGDDAMISDMGFDL